MMQNENLKKIFEFIHLNHPITRKEISERTNYSPATVSNHVNTLLEKKFLVEERKGYSTGGRKPIYLNINPKKSYILIIEIQVETVFIYLYNLKLKKIKHKKLKPKMNDFQKVADLIKDKCTRIIKSHNLTIQNVMGVGVSVPGIVDNNKVLKFAPNLNWHMIDISKALNDFFHIPVIVENDANCAVIGEKYKRHSKSKDLVYVLIEKGVGCGLIINNQLYRGAKGGAGDFGHMIVNSSEKAKKCHCGNKGCWQTVASEDFLLESYNKINPNSNLTIKDICFMAKKNNEIRRTIFEFSNNISLGIINIINGLNPELIIIGGEIANCESIIYDKLMQEIKNKVLDFSNNDIKILFSKRVSESVQCGLAKLILSRCIKF